MSTYSQFHRVHKFSWKKGSRLWETKRIENVYSKCFFFGNDFVAGFRAWCKTEKCLMMMIRWPFAFAFRLSYFEKMKNFYQTKKTQSNWKPDWINFSFFTSGREMFWTFFITQDPSMCDLLSSMATCLMANRFSMQINAFDDFQSSCSNLDKYIEECERENINFYRTWREKRVCKYEIRSCKLLSIRKLKWLGVEIQKAEN